MTLLTPALIKPVLTIAALAAILLYVRHLNSELDTYKTNYEAEKSLHQQAANSLLAERINATEAYKEALVLEGKFNEIQKQNTKYRDCVIKRNCYVSLRKSESKTSGLLPQSSGPGSSINDSSDELDGELQQSILVLREEVEKAAEQIIGLQSYINTYCYKIN